MARNKTIYNIRQVIELTGVSEFTIRGWENRYQAITPQRTETGRRLYNQEDVLKIKALHDLVEQGHKISSIAGLTYEELLQQVTYENVVVSQGDSDIERIITLSNNSEWDKLKKLLEKKRTSLAPKEFLLVFLLDLIRAINDLVNLGKFSIAQEHILSAMIQESLQAIKSSSLSANQKKSCLIFTCPEGELHDIGLLIAATLASHSRVPNLYLGPNTPKQSLCDVALRYNPGYIVLTSTIPKEKGAAEDFLSYLNFLDRQLPKQIEFWIGGPHANSLSFSLKRRHRVVQTLQELNTLFENL